uniref:UDP-glucuronosyltransferase 3A1-like n=1 Tax=Panthera onca TaxID=9690 RepID=UPI002954ECDD|nr:UDP-glucuronosyltransferase 3A1-like [Panthera onca]
MEQLGIQCSDLLRRSDIMDSLKNENFDLVFVEAFDFCSFLIAEKLGKPFVSILPSPFGSVDLGLPNPVSYVPVFRSLLTDHMDFWGRVKNFLMFLDFFLRQWRIQSTFDNTIKEHFSEDSRPVLSHLLKKAELWFVNSDFALEFARPLLPNTVYVGGLMARPVKPVPQVSKTLALNRDFMQSCSVNIELVAPLPVGTGTEVGWDKQNTFTFIFTFFYILTFMSLVYFIVFYSILNFILYW